MAADAAIFEGTSAEVEAEVASMIDDGYSVSGITVSSANRILVLFTKA